MTAIEKNLIRSTCFKVITRKEFLQEITVQKFLFIQKMIDPKDMFTKHLKENTYDSDKERLDIKIARICF